MGIQNQVIWPELVVLGPVWGLGKAAFEALINVNTLASVELGARYQLKIYQSSRGLGLLNHPSTL